MLQLHNRPLHRSFLCLEIQSCSNALDATYRIGFIIFLRIILYIFSFSHFLFKGYTGLNSFALFESLFESSRTIRFSNEEWNSAARGLKKKDRLILLNLQNKMRIDAIIGKTRVLRSLTLIDEERVCSTVKVRWEGINPRNIDLVSIKWSVKWIKETRKGERKKRNTRIINLFGNFFFFPFLQTIKYRELPVAAVWNHISR